MSPGAAVALALLLDVALVAALLSRARGPIDSRRLLLVVACGLLFALAQGALVALAWRRFFLSVHLLHAFLFLVAPAFGLLLALGRPWRVRRGARALAATGALILAAIGIDSSVIEPSRLVTERATVQLAPARAGRAELRIGVLADLQCDRIGEHERQAVAQLMAERPDLILLPGDVAQAGGAAEFRALLPELRALLAALSAPLGVYCVLGDTDTAGGLTELFEGTDVRLLRNESVELAWRDRRITLAGVARLPDDEEGLALLGRLSAAGGDDLRLLLVHKPDWALQLPAGGRIDLVVAGHTHGGQVRLPGVGPLLTLSQIPREMAGGGLFALGGSPLYVSRGVGIERGDAPRVRFNCPPEVSLLTLRTADGTTAGP